MLLLQNLLRLIQPEIWFQHSYKYQSKFDAVSKCQKVNSDLWSCYSCPKVPYFGQVPLQHQILLCNYSDRVDDRIPIRIWCYSWMSERQDATLVPDFYILDTLSTFGIRPHPCNSVPKLYETFPTNIGRYYTSSPVRAYACVPVPSKRLLPSR